LAPGTVQVIRPRVLGVGLGAVVVAAALVTVLRTPAPAVAAIGCGAIGLRLATRRIARGRVFEVLGLPLLLGLFGIAVAFGTLGRVWGGPATALSHLDIWGTAAVAALTAVLVNNLPAASLLASRVPAHPLALLIGLNLGPNLFVSGSLAWVIWLRVARAAGADPSIKRASLLGAAVVPLSIVAAVAVLLAGPHH
jgi:arsenical pump membrane protein